MQAVHKKSFDAVKMRSVQACRMSARRVLCMVKGPYHVVWESALEEAALRKQLFRTVAAAL